MLGENFTAVALTGLLFVGCGGAGQTGPTPVSGGAGPTGPTPVTGTSLADQIQGTFKGQFQSPSYSSSDYQIIVTKIDDDTVRISPASGSTSSTFDADLALGTATSITLTAPSDDLANNGTFVAATGRLAYTYWFDSSSTDDSKIEVFSGTKQ